MARFSTELWDAGVEFRAVSSSLAAQVGCGVGWASEGLPVSLVMTPIVVNRLWACFIPCKMGQHCLPEKPHVHSVARNPE